MGICIFCGHRLEEGCGTCEKYICIKCGRHEGGPEDCPDWA